MKKLGKLKNVERFRSVSIMHDMSKAEIEENKHKLDRAKELNEKEKSGNFRFVVRGPPWERKIVKINLKT